MERPTLRKIRDAATRMAGMTRRTHRGNPPLKNLVLTKKRLEHWCPLLPP